MPDLGRGKLYTQAADGQLIEIDVERLEMDIDRQMLYYGEAFVPYKRREPATMEVVLPFPDTSIRMISALFEVGWMMEGCDEL